MVGSSETNVCVVGALLLAGTRSYCRQHQPLLTSLALRADEIPADKGGPEAFLVDRSGVVLAAVRGVDAAFLGAVQVGRAFEGVLTGDCALLVRLSNDVRPSGVGVGGGAESARRRDHLRVGVEVGGW